ncbi:unnamed protein product [Meganyctiphanes norvegica]|uniref:Uncharacterized protein n=1 Tax=Meganyctiphanes norvegica TaxID=48144 RepID=A0AAV2RY91_MEGNR
MQMYTVAAVLLASLFALILVTEAHPAPDPDAFPGPVAAADPHRRRRYGGGGHRQRYGGHHGGYSSGGHHGGYSSGLHAHQTTHYDAHGGHHHHTILHHG